MPLSLKLASDGGCKLTDGQKTTFVRHLREVRELANIPMAEAELLVRMVGALVSNGIQLPIGR